MREGEELDIPTPFFYWMLVKFVEILLKKSNFGLAHCF